MLRYKELSLSYKNPKTNEVTQLDPSPYVKDRTISGLDLSGMFVNSFESGGLIFRSCNFKETAFKEECELLTNTFDNCNFENSDLSDLDLSLCDFKNCNLIKADLGQTDLSYTTFEDCALQFSSLVGAKGSGTSFERCTLNCADFTDHRLHSPTFFPADSKDCLYVEPETPGATTLSSVETRFPTEEDYELLEAHGYLGYEGWGDWRREQVHGATVGPCFCCRDPRHFLGSL